MLLSKMSNVSKIFCAIFVCAPRLLPKSQTSQTSQTIACFSAHRLRHAQESQTIAVFRGAKTTVVVLAVFVVVLASTLLLILPRPLSVLLRLLLLPLLLVPALVLVPLLLLLLLLLLGYTAVGDPTRFCSRDWRTEDEHPHHVPLLALLSHYQNNIHDNTILH